MEVKQLFKVKEEFLTQSWAYAQRSILYIKKTLDFLMYKIDIA